jgi:hypothetical protein
MVMVVMGAVGMEGDVPMRVGVEAVGRWAGRMMEVDERVGVGEMVKWLGEVEGEWNLPSRRKMEEKFREEKERRKVREEIKVEDIKIDGKRFGREKIVWEENGVKRMALLLAIDERMEEIKSANTIYVNTVESPIIHPKFSKIIIISTYINKILTPWILAPTQSTSESSYTTILYHAQIQFHLHPSKITISPCPSLTHSILSTFPSSKYSTCSYFYLSHITSLCPFPPSSTPSSTQNLLFCLKSLAFLPPSKISPTLTILKTCFKTPAEASIISSFEEVFIKKFNSEYWSCLGEEVDACSQVETMVEGIYGLVADWDEWWKRIATTTTTTTIKKEKRVMEVIKEGRYGLEEVVEEGFVLEMDEGQEGMSQSSNWTSSTNITNESMRFWQLNEDTQGLESYFKWMYPRKGGNRVIQLLRNTMRTM